RQPGADLAAGDIADGVAGLARRRSRRLRADADPVRHPGDPGIAGRVSCDHDEDLEPVPIPARAACRGRGGDAAPRADGVAAARPADAAGPARLYGDRRAVERAAAG